MNETLNITTEEPQDAPKGKGKRKWTKPLIILGGIILGIVLLGVSCNPIGGGPIPPGGDLNEDHIAVLHVEGVISAESTGSLMGGSNSYNHEFLLSTIEEAKHNDQNKGIMLYVNTPGGSVYESDELYLKIKEYQQETGRPVYTYMAAMAASGGYYISAPTDKIIANRNTWTGSIGVTIGTIYDVTGLMEKYGIKAVTIDSGANKSMGSITQPMTPEQQEIFQGLVNEAYEQFVSIVAEGRSLSVDQVKTLADGRIYTAKQAMEVGLVDEIATFGEAKEKMIEDYGLGQCNFYDFQPQEMGLLETLMSTASQLNAGSGGDIQSLMQLMNKKGDFPIAYMSDWTK